MMEDGHFPGNQDSSKPRAYSLFYFGLRDTRLFMDVEGMEE